MTNCGCVKGKRPPLSQSVPPALLLGPVRPLAPLIVAVGRKLTGASSLRVKNEIICVPQRLEDFFYFKKGGEKTEPRCVQAR